MKAVLLLVSGALIFGVTFAAWYWLNAFGCGMNPTGCGGVSLHWDDWEALQHFVPTFLLGMALMVAGLWHCVRR
ncbi:hypothetical protein [Stappia indica]|uniref:hypothetical protein n=1 Tax=Stappia indica TaxID=538381 RepID=UPI001CD533A8|nr:hypothetical protein [Stappia indica]MCA1297831.1 hypothetical protein [Stappia indica]